jgi:hypothetical protein
VESPEWLVAERRRQLTAKLKNCVTFLVFAQLVGKTLILVL